MAYFGENACAAWVNFNGQGTVSIRDDYNISSITDHGSGDDGMPSSAIYAIIGLVVLAVIGGAFILTRGAEADGEDKEWDY